MRNMKAGIVIDKWKLPIFEEHLTKAGYVYAQKPGLTGDTLLLTVETTDAAALQDVVQAANDAAARIKKKR